jgi:hypothetical protein
MPLRLNERGRDDMRIVRLMISIWLFATPVFAQDAAKSAALDRFMKVMNTEAGYTILGQGALQSFAPLALMNPGKEQVVGKLIETELVPELRANRSIYNRALRAAYAKRFSTAELNAISNFVESPPWQKMRKSEQEVQGEAAASLGPLQKKIQTSIGPRILAKMKAQGLKVPPPAPAGK